MEFDNFKKWIDSTQTYQTESFWNQIFDEKNQKKENLTHKNPFTVAQEFIPKCDLYEIDDDLILEMEIPGLKKEDLHLFINHRTFTVMGEFKSFQPQNKYFLKERANRKFKKELTLPYPILIHSIHSTLNNGILTIRMPINREEVENVPISFNSNDPN